MFLEFFESGLGIFEGELALVFKGFDDGGAEFGEAGFGKFFRASLVALAVAEELFVEPDGDAHGGLAFGVSLGVGGDPDLGAGEGFHGDGLEIGLGGGEGEREDEEGFHGGGLRLKAEGLRFKVEGLGWGSLPQRRRGRREGTEVFGG